MIRMIRTVLVIFMLLAVWRCCQLVIPERPEYTENHIKLVTKASQEAASWLGKIELEQAKTYFGNLDRDDFGFVSYHLRKTIRQSDKVNLMDRSTNERFLELIHWRIPTCKQTHQLLEQARKQGCKYAIGGKICKFSQYIDTIELAVELHVWEVGEPKLVGQTALKLSSQGNKISIQTCEL